MLVQQRAVLKEKMDKIRYLEAQLEKEKGRRVAALDCLDELVKNEI